MCDCGGLHLQWHTDGTQRARNLTVGFVEWAGVVLDKLIEAHTSSPQARRGGVTQGLLAEMIFGAEMANQPEFQDSGRHIALQQAIQELEAVGLVVYPPPTPDPVVKGWRPSKLA